MASSIRLTRGWGGSFWKSPYLPPKDPKIALTFSGNMTSGIDKNDLDSTATAGKKAFFERLKQADVATIRSLALMIAPEVRSLVRQAGLPGEDVEELLHDAILVTLSAIRKGAFQFIDVHPASYAKGVARKLAANRARTKKPLAEWDDRLAGTASFTPEDHLQNKERVAIVRELLDRLGEDCRRVLLLKYFEHRRDQEVIEEKLTAYSTTGSLKSKRGQCLKKLADLARNAGLREAF